MPDECFPQITFILEKTSKFSKFTKEISGHFKDTSDYPILHEPSTEMFIL